MRLKLNTVLLSGFLLLLLVAIRPARAAESYKVIVNASNPVSSMKKDQASRLFLKKVAKWDHGPAVVAVDLPKTSAARQAFSIEVHGKPVKAIDSYWQQKIFSGREVPPLEKASDAQVVAFVKANAGAIGYVSAAAGVGGVKVLTLE